MAAFGVARRPGRATALLDMTKCFEQVRLWHVWRWGLSLGLPPWAPPSDPLGFQLPAQSGTLGCDVAAHADVRGHHCGVSFSRARYAVHLAL